MLIRFVYCHIRVLWLYAVTSYQTHDNVTVNSVIFAIGDLLKTPGECRFAIQMNHVHVQTQFYY